MLNANSSPSPASEEAVDGRYGYTLDDLLAVAAPTVFDGFEAFWRDAHARARAIDPQPTYRLTTLGNADHSVWEVEFDSLDGLRAGGWLVTRRDRWPTNPTRAIVVGHGYGGREAPDLDIPGGAEVALYPCARGFHRSAHPDYPSTAAEHVLVGIESAQTYSHLGSTADLVWCAANALQALFGTVERLWYSGRSFGGGIGAFGLPWDDRYDKAFLGLPSFGNHPLRLTLPCVGSGQAIQQKYAGNPGIMATLVYFDAAVHARLLRIPVLFELALEDPAVPPPGQFAMYNVAGGPTASHLRLRGHIDYQGTPSIDDEDALMVAAVEQWFGQ